MPITDEKVWNTDITSKGRNGESSIGQNREPLSIGNLNVASTSALAPWIDQLDKTSAFSSVYVTRLSITSLRVLTSDYLAVT